MALKQFFHGKTNENCVFDIFFLATYWADAQSWKHLSIFIFVQMVYLFLVVLIVS